MQLAARPAEVLESVLARTRTVSDAVLVFDLDSTLLDNRPRQARILSEFGALKHLPQLVAAKPEHWQGWSMEVAMRNTGLPEADVLRLVAEARTFWRERFFTSEYCAIDEAIAGAVPFVAAVQKAGGRVAYCTGRHEEMRAGSVQCFQRLGLPLPDQRVQLLMKPRIDISDDEWKRTAYALIRQLGTVVATFDNEPTHINGYREAFPDAAAVHLATDHSGREVTLSAGVLSIKNFG